MYRWCVILMTVCSLLTVSSRLPAGEDDPGFKGGGLCQFLCHGYVLPPPTEGMINLVVSKALKEHREVFGFPVAPGFHVRIRIFGRYEDYETFTLKQKKDFDVPIDSESISNLSGYYSVSTREIVTWRQRQPDHLANNILHEASHAIMCGHFKRIPPWLSEGCATYFAFPSNIQDAHDVGSLKYRWALLNLWLREKQLPSLRSFVNLTDVEWHRLNPDEAYTVSWSIFQHLMSTGPKKRVLRGLLNALQTSLGPKMDSAAQLERLYPGGLQRLEQDWHRWIREVGSKVLGPNWKLPDEMEPSRLRKKQ